MDYPTLALTVVGILSATWIIRRVLATFEVRMKANMTMYRTKMEEKLGTLHIEEWLNQLPRMSQELEKLKMEMQARGATPEQLAPIQQRRDLVGKAQQWEPILRLAAPIINRLGGKTLTSGMKMLESLLTG